MGSFKHPRAFNPLDLEIRDRVYEAAWAQVEAGDHTRDTAYDWQRQDAVRKLIMDCTATERIEFDALYDRVLGICRRRGPSLCHPRRHRNLARFGVH
jgi:hypothetical protein